MWYSYWEIIKDWKVYPIWYWVEDICNHKWCKENIDRWMSYLCNSCNWYFCWEHQTSFYCKSHDEAVECDWAIFSWSQICYKCEKQVSIDIKNWDYECHSDYQIEEFNKLRKEKLKYEENKKH